MYIVFHLKAGRHNQRCFDPHLVHARSSYTDLRRQPILPIMYIQNTVYSEGASPHTHVPPIATDADALLSPINLLPRRHHILLLITILLLPIQEILHKHPRIQQ
jgi:hypothetical protein